MPRPTMVSGLVGACAGDSNTTGTAPALGGTDKAWPAVMAGQAMAGLLQSGQGGSALVEWVGPGGLYESVLQPLMPRDVVVVMFGTVDAIPAPVLDRSAVEYRADLESLVAAIVADGASAVLVLHPPPSYYTKVGTSQAFEDQVNARIQEYRDEIDDLASSDPQVFSGVPENAAIPKDQFLDAVHLNEAQQALLAMRVARDMQAVSFPDAFARARSSSGSRGRD